MGSTSDMPVLEKAAKLLDEFEIPFEINAAQDYCSDDKDLIYIIVPGDTE